MSMATTYEHLDLVPGCLDVADYCSWLSREEFLTTGGENAGKNDLSGPFCMCVCVLSVAASCTHVCATTS